jgi:hypothetical protein
MTLCWVTQDDVSYLAQAPVSIHPTEIRLLASILVGSGNYTILFLALLIFHHLTETKPAGTAPILNYPVKLLLVSPAQSFLVSVSSRSMTKTFILS